MPGTEQNYKKIIKEIRLYESAPTLEGMERMGLKYKKNFGVSLINLKKIAEKYKPDKYLAELLRNKGFRETIILSFMIDDIDKIQEKDISNISKLLSTQELAEQFVINILEKNKKFHPFAEKLILSDKEFQISAGFILYARTALIDKEKDDAFFEAFFDKGFEYAFNNSIYIRKSAARAFRQVAMRNNNLKEKVIKIAEKIKKYDNPNANLVYEETLPLIKY
ncbi:MAG: hypothetical protein GXO50_02555 [Chlorobi bacterium]|nr:hypothetical protein [Chlorobiota bacterium]